jgi:hypothetical protein
LKKQLLQINFNLLQIWCLMQVFTCVNLDFTHVMFLELVSNPLSALASPDASKSLLYSKKERK